MIKHAYSNIVADGTATTVVRPSDWNSAHVQQISISGNTAGVSSFAAGDVVFQGGNNLTLSAAVAGAVATVLFSAADAAALTHTHSQYLTTAAQSDHAHSQYLTTAQPVGAYLTTAAQSDHTHTQYVNTSQSGLFQHTSGTSAITSNAAHSTHTHAAYLTTAAQSGHSHGAVAFSGTNVSGSFTSASNGLSIQLSAPNLGGGGGGAALSAGTQSVSSGTVAFANSNGISFGMSGSNQITASHNGLTTAAQSNHSHGVSLNLTNINGTTGGNSAGITLSLSAVVPAQTVQPVAYSAANGSAAFSTLPFANSNGVSFSTGTQGIYGTVKTDYLTTAAQSNHSHGNPTLALTNLSGTTASNSAGFTLSLSGGAGGGGGGVAWSNATGGLSTSGTLHINHTWPLSNSASNVRIFLTSSSLVGRYDLPIVVRSAETNTNGLAYTTTGYALTSYIDTRINFATTFGTNLEQGIMVQGQGTASDSIFPRMAYPTSFNAGGNTIPGLNTSAAVKLNVNLQSLVQGSGGISVGFRTEGYLLGLVISGPASAAPGAIYLSDSLGAGTSKTLGSLSLLGDLGVVPGHVAFYWDTAYSAVNASAYCLTQVEMSSNTVAGLATSGGLYNILKFKGVGGVSIGFDGAQGQVVISGGAGGGGGVAISGGTQLATSGSVVFSNSNGISFGLSGSTRMTASHNGLTTARASNDGIGLNTALTANGVAWTVNSSGFSLNVPAFLTTAMQSQMTSNYMSTVERGNYFYTSNNTFANSTHSHGNPTLALTNLTGTTASGSAGFTLSLSAGPAGVINQTGPNIAVAGSTITSGDVVFSNANGVTFGMAGSTITASAAGGGGGVTNNGHRPFDQEMVAGQQGNGTLFFANIGSMPNFKFDHLQIPVQYVATSNSSGSFTASFWVGLYTRNASSLSLLHSTSHSVNITNSGTVGSYSLFAGMRNIQVPWTSTVTEGGYWLAVASRTTTGGAAGMTMSQWLVSNPNTVNSGIFGSSVNGSRWFLPFQGHYSATTNALPAAVSITQINGTASLNLRPPVVNFISGTL